MVWEKVATSMVAFDTKTLFAGLALIIALLSYRRSVKSDQRSIETTKRQSRSELQRELYEVWMLLGGDLEQGKIATKKPRADINLAKRILDRCMIVAPDYADVHLHYGSWYFLKGDFDRAEDYFRRALELEPLHVVALNNLGIILVQFGAMNEAITCFKKAIQLEPDNPILYCNVGNLCLRLREFDQAQLFLGRSLHHDPLHVASYLNLGALALRQGNINDVSRFFNKAIELDSSLHSGIEDFRVHKLIGCYCRNFPMMESI